jgi:hypothetical protein
MSFTWQDVERIRANFEPWRDTALITLDTVEPVAANLHKIRRRLASDGIL